MGHVQLLRGGGRVRGNGCPELEMGSVKFHAAPKPRQRVRSYGVEVGSAVAAHAMGEMQEMVASLKCVKRWKNFFVPRYFFCFFCTLFVSFPL
jgi:hypothetical protein